VGLLARIGLGKRAHRDSRDPRSDRLEQALRLIDEGMGGERQGRTADALRHYDAAIRLAPQLVRAHLNRGNVLLQMGEAAPAAEAYATALAQDPDCATAHYGLGQAYTRLGQAERAGAAYRRVIALQPEAADAEVALAGVLATLGQPDAALASYDRALQIRPEYAQAHRDRGDLLGNLGRHDKAVASYRRALAIEPADLAANNNLGTALLQLGQFEAAAASFRVALQIDPAIAAVHFNLGNALKDLGQLGDAVTSYRRALEISPDLAVAHCNLANALRDLGQLRDAVISYRRALEISPDLAVAHRNLGGALKGLGQLHDAVASYRQGIAIDPGNAIAHYGLGDALLGLRQLNEAVACYERSLQINPDCAEAHTNLGVAQKLLGQLHDSVASHQRALQINADFAGAHTNLGNTLKDLGRIAEAVASYRRALEIEPELAEAHSNLLLALNYSANHDPEYCLGQARRFGRMLDAKGSQRFRVWKCPPRPARLRVGLVSGDLRDHSVGYFLAGPLAHIDPAQIELIAYPTVDFEDPLTATLRGYFAAWKPLSRKDDAEAARLIYADDLHILLDLSGHTANNRLPVFARRPAPVQCSWLGYFATTGVAQMDHLLGDPYVTPAGEAAHFTEQIWRLPECYLCFAPPNVSLDVGPLPARTRGQIVFGCFNNLAKMNDAVVVLWARVLQAVPNARLFLKTAQLNDPLVRETTMRRLMAHGIAPDRLDLEGSAPRAQLLAAYARVDIALDPYPYPGGTTSAEALWMGVPVVTRRGDRFLAHVGESIAHNAGLAHWIAVDDDDYVAKAVAFAGNLDHLADLRAGLRQQVLRSPLFDARRFARHWEEALWGMWRNGQARGRAPT
jgi:protein O-GlcNAc transferase